MIKISNKNNSLSPFRTLTNFPTIFPSDIFEEMDKFFTGLNVFDRDTLNLKISGFPKGDLFVEDGKLIIELALAGYSKEQLSVLADDTGSLVVSADKTESNGGRSLARRSFTRTFPQLGRGWDVAVSDVTYCNGLLRIVVPPVAHKEEVMKKLEIK
jgi:HSP20 family molecular chaperone IbpA